MHVKLVPVTILIMYLLGRQELRAQAVVKGAYHAKA
jgi:hypothetical protein